MKKFLTIIATLAFALALLSVNLPAKAQGPGEDVGGTVDEGSNAAGTPAADDSAAPVEQSNGAVDENAASATAPDQESAAPAEQAGGAVEEFDGVGLGGLNEAVQAAQIDDNQANNTYTANTMFAAQNPGTTDASVSVTIYGTDGVSAFTDSKTVTAGRAYMLDQATQALAANFQGAAVLSSDTELAVTTLIKSTSATAKPRYDTYNGFPSNKAGLKLTVPQFMKDIVSLGDTYNSLLSIQNTGTAAATVSVEYKASVKGTSATKTYNIPVNGSVYVKSEDLTELGTDFFGYVVVSSTNSQPVVAVATIHSGEKGSTNGSMFALEGFANNLTTASGEVFGGQMYKGITSGGCTYGSAVSIANVGSTKATITVKYYPSALGTQFSGGPAFSYNLDIAAGGFSGIDQRFDTNITTNTFYGGISLQVTAGEVAAISNVRAALCNSLQTNSVPVTANSGSKAVAPMVFKNNKTAISTNYTWFTAIGIQNLSSSPTSIKITYYPFDASVASTTYNVATPIAANSSLSIDQRFESATNLAEGFAGTIVIESLTAGNKIRGAVNIRGNSGPDGDALAGYNLITLN